MAVDGRTYAALRYAAKASVMGTEIVVTYTNTLSVLLAFVAAGCWLYSAVVRVKPVEGERDEDGMKPARIVTEGTDLFKSLRAQSLWNAVAASFAGMSAIAQAIALLLK